MSGVFVVGYPKLFCRRLLSSSHCSFAALGLTIQMANPSLIREREKEREQMERERESEK